MTIALGRTMSDSDRKIKSFPVGIGRIFMINKIHETMRKIFALMLLTVCSSVALAQNKPSVDYKESSARNLEPQHSVMITPLIADLSIIGDRIVYTEKEAFENYQVTSEIVKFIPNFKKVALSRAARAYKADAIIGATVDVITNPAGRLEITVSGYPAKYSNFRNATAEDISLVKQGLDVMTDNNADVLTSPGSQTKIEIEK